MKKWELVLVVIGVVMAMVGVYIGVNNSGDVALGPGAPFHQYGSGWCGFVDPAIQYIEIIPEDPPYCGIHEFHQGGSYMSTIPCDAIYDCGLCPPGLVFKVPNGCTCIVEHCEPDGPAGSGDVSCTGTSCYVTRCVSPSEWSGCGFTEVPDGPYYA